jgi:hypothetical protein
VPPATVPTPPTTTTTDRDPLLDSLRGWLATGGTQESTGSRGPVSDVDLNAAVERHLQQMNAGVAMRGEPVRNPTELRLAASQVVADARRALERTAAGESARNLSDRERSCLEAIVRVTGRPATRFLAAGLEIPDQDLGANERWALIAGQMYEEIESVAESVGRISLGVPGAAVTQLGTVWRLGSDLVVTNRHVAKEVAADASANASTWKMRDDASCFIDFAATHAGGAPKAFAVQELVFCSDVEDLDAAVFRLGAQAKAPPPALPIDFERSSVMETVQRANGEWFDRGKEVYVIGHPYRETASDASWMVFGDADGKKRWSPGEVTSIDATHASCLHDCSTLGGSSGSCILTLASHKVVGMHFGGRNVDEATGRGDANLGLTFALVQHPAFQRILRTGQVA